MPFKLRMLGKTRVLFRACNVDNDPTVPKDKKAAVKAHDEKIGCCTTEQVAQGLRHIIVFEDGFELQFLESEL